MPSAMERLGETLKEFDFEALLNDVGSAIRGIDELTNSADLRQAITSLTATINDFQKLVQDVNAKVGSLATRFDETAVAARGRFKTGETLDSVRGRGPERDAKRHSTVGEKH